MTTTTSPARHSRSLAFGVLLAAGVLLAGCAGSGGSDAMDEARRSQPTATTSATSSPSVPDPSASPAPPQEPTVYAAVGASETVGVGADRPTRQAWPRVLHDRALTGTRYVNVGVSGSTAGQALTEQLPQALAVRPDVVTVWLAVNDITHLVPVQAYEPQLRTLVHELRQQGRARVLVANVPPVDRLPAYLACLPSPPAHGPACSLPVVPPPAQVRQLVGSYNEAIARVVAQEGATLVDLSGEQDLSRLTADDGFHPSTQGHSLVAAAFARVLNQES